MSQNPYPTAPPPLQQPVRVQPIEYSMPPQRRPGLVTAIGVISIVVGGLGILGNLVSGMQWIGMLFVSQMAPRFSTTSSVVISAPTAGPSNAADAIGPRGLGLSQRQQVEVALLDQRGLAPERVQHLDALLAQAGLDLFPFEQVTQARVRSSVSESGRLPDLRTSAGADYFILGNGRIEISDAQAVYFPSDGKPIVRASANTPAASAGASVDVQMSTGGVSVQGAGPATANVPNPFASLTVLPLVLGMIESVLSFALAVYLLVIGILVFRGSRGGRRQHRLYAILKFPLALLAAAATMLLWRQLLRGMPFPGARPASAVVLIPGILMLLLSLAYPIGLLFALRASSVRAYYDGLR